MNRPPDREQLLADVLAEGAPPDFRAALLAETLRGARRRRRLRRARHVAVVAAIVGALGIFTWRKSPPRAPSSPSAAPAVATNYELVRTRALPAAARIATQPLAAERVVASFTGVAMIRTPADERALRLIGDDELLALVAPRTAALIRLAPDEQELVIVDATDAKDSR